MGDEDRTPQEVQEHRDRRCLPRGVGDHALGDAGEHRDEGWDRLLGVHEGAELAEDLAATHLHRPDLGDPALGGTATGRFEVHHAERGPRQRLTIEVEIESGAVRGAVQG